MTTVNNDFLAECFSKPFFGNTGRTGVKLNAEQALKQIFNPTRKISEIPPETLRAYAKIFKPLI